MNRLVLNRIRTPDGTILTSYYRHDYKTYTDKNGLTYMVDGGLDYLRRNDHPYEELSVYEDAPWEKIRESFHRGTYGKNGDEELHWVPMSEMSNKWLESCISYNSYLGQDKSFSSDMYRKELDYRKIKNIFIDDNS